MLSLFLALIILQLSNAEYTIDASQEAGDIICSQNDDCVVDCTLSSCDSKTITCETGYACTINCVECPSVTASAEGVSNFAFTCQGNCNSVTITASLQTIDSIFMLNCTGNDACSGLDATIDHIQSVYEGSATTTVDYNVEINCESAGVCANTYFESTTAGNFYIKCSGLEACSRSIMVHNPPQSLAVISNMNVDCLGVSDDKTCYGVNIISLTATQINLNCGDDTTTSADQKGLCGYASLLGPLLPFDDGVSYSFNNIKQDSVNVNCNGNECYSFSAYLLFGGFQMTVTGYENGAHGLTRACGFDFANSGWNHPQRRLDCNCQEVLETIPLQKLIDGAQLTVTNKYTFSLSANSQLTCNTNNHCIIYSMERYNKGLYAYNAGNYDTEFTNYISSSASTQIICPTDGESECQIYAIQQYGLSLSNINGAKTGLLLLRGLDNNLDAESAFTLSTIYSPDTDYASNGILFLEAGNAVGSFRYATFHAENSGMNIVNTVFNSIQYSTWYLDDTTWTDITCGYHSMCNGMTVTVNHNSFNAATDNIIPNNICIGCFPRSDSCVDVKLNITDTTNSITYQFDAIYTIDTWYWVNSVLSKQIEITTTAESAGPTSNCTHQTEELMPSWYDGEQNGKCGNGGGGGGFALPNGCNWIAVPQISADPAVDFCYTDFFDQQYSWKQQCVAGAPVVTLYAGSSNCIGSGQIYTEASGDCSYDTLCNYATYSLKNYETDNDTCNDMDGYYPSNKAVFTDICLNGVINICDGTTLTMRMYDNVTCNGVYEDIVYSEGDCMDDIFVTDISCVHVELTTTEFVCDVGDDELKDVPNIAANLRETCKICLCQQAEDGEIAENCKSAADVDNLPTGLINAFMNVCKQELTCAGGNINNVKPKDGNDFECTCDGFECITTGNANMRFISFVSGLFTFFMVIIY